MLNVAINGGTGRMGQEIILAIKQNPDKYNLSFATARNISLDNEEFFLSELPASSTAEVLIDFSSPESLIKVLDWCILHDKPLMVGTTGYNSEQLDLIAKASAKIPVLLSPNTSLSVNVLFKVSQIVAKMLSNSEVEIVESHHRYKKDAPSGTALRLGQAIASARGLDFNNVANFNRIGSENKIRTPEEIGFSVVRGGDIVGKHTVSFINDGEELNLTSEITNRRSFALGALLAAKFVAGCKPGLFNMDHALGINGIS